MTSIAPLPFITVENNGQFKINPEATSIIKRIPGRIVVLTIAGSYRTGKSFLLNALIAQALQRGLISTQTTSTDETINLEKDKLSGFQVAGTVNACTKGIWMWAEPLQYRDATTILFLDTEGLNATRCENNYDVKLFSLLLLISSTLIYNSRGTIDSHALEDLSLVLNISRHIQSNMESENGAGKGFIYPSFLWIVRDFTLKLKDQRGFTITSRDYLERTLRPCHSASTSASQDCIRSALVESFPRRNCITMVRPILEETKLQKEIPRGDVRLDELRPEFLKNVDDLLECIFDDSTEENSLNGKNLDGTMYCDLVAAYAEAMNNRDSVDVNNAWMVVVQEKCEKTVQEAVVIYHHEMQKHIRENLFSEADIPEGDQDNKGSLVNAIEQTYGASFGTIQNVVEVMDVELLEYDPGVLFCPRSVSLPSREEDLASIHRYCKHLAKTYFYQTLANKCCKEESAKHYESLRLQVATIYDSFCNDNIDASMSYCRSLLHYLLTKHSFDAIDDEANPDTTKSATEFIQNQADQLHAQYSKYALGVSADAAYVEYITTQMLDALVDIRKQTIKHQNLQFSSLDQEIKDRTGQLGLIGGEARTMERLFAFKQQSLQLVAKENEQRYDHEIFTLQQELKYENDKLEHLLDHNATLKRMVELAQEGQTRTAEYVNPTSVAKMEGYLLQANVQATGGWEQIYVVMNDRTLSSYLTKSYYTRAKASSLVHSLIGASLKVDCLAPEAFQIVFDQSHHLTLRAKSIEAKNQWITSIREAIRER